MPRKHFANSRHCQTISMRSDSFSRMLCATGFLLATGLLLIAMETSLLAQQDTDQEPVLRKPDAPETNLSETEQKDRIDSEGEEIVTAKLLAAEMAAIEARTDLDEATVASLQSLFTEARDLVDAFEKADANRLRYDEVCTTIIPATEQTRKSLAEFKLDPEQISEDLPLEDLQQRLAAAQAALKQTRLEADQLAAEPARRQERVANIPKQRDAIRIALMDIEEQLEADASESELPVVARARRLNLLVKRQLLKKQDEELVAEAAAYVATSELLPIQRDQMLARLSYQQKEFDEISKAISNQHEIEARKLISQTRDATRSLPAGLQPIAEENLTLAHSVQETQRKNRNITSQLQALQSRRDILAQELSTARSRVKAVGLTEALGYMLRQKRNELETERTNSRPASDAKNLIRDLQVETYGLEDRLARLDKLNESEQAEALAADVDANVKDANKSEIQSLLMTRRELLQKNIRARNDLFQNQISVDTARHGFVNDADTFISFIDKHVLWIRSAPPVGLQTLPDAINAARWLADSGNWRMLVAELWNGIKGGTPIYLLAGIGVLGLFTFRGRLKRIIGEVGDRARDRRRIEYSPTFTSLMATLLLALCWPAPLLLIGWILKDRSSVGEFPSAIGHGLVGVGLFVLPLELLRNLWRDKGLAEAHFLWGEDMSRFFRQHLRWFLGISIPALFVMVIFHYQDNDQWRNSLGRLSAVVLFLSLAALTYIIFHPEGVFFVRLKSTYKQSRLLPLRLFIHPLMVAIPIVLGVISLAGYFYTAYQLGGCLQQTTTAFILILVALGMVLRLLYLRRRRLIRNDAIARLAALKSQELPADSSKVIAESAGIEIQEEQDARLSSISEQARKVIMVSFIGVAVAASLLIWKNVLPAVGILDQVNLWQVTIAERIEQVTLADLFYAFVTMFITYVAVQNVPGLLELVVLRHTVQDNGARYAITTIFRYFLIVIGLMTALGFLKVPWSQYGWLVAAVTVGLGFGLQEIVANFVSGLILLLERPVRVGDVVTVDGVEGVVSRIQMRATTITNWDRQELIVPNKDLITGKLLNWSLSNVINRVVINVQVAYDSDVQQVMQIIDRITSAHEHVLEDPEPLVNFASMGDSALNFVVRCYLSGLDHRVATIHELNEALLQELTSAGISIPFPQSELTVKAVPSELTRKFNGERRDEE